MQSVAWRLLRLYARDGDEAGRPPQTLGTGATNGTYSGAGYTRMSRWRPVTRGQRVVLPGRKRRGGRLRRSLQLHVGSGSFSIIANFRINANIAANNFMRIFWQGMGERRLLPYGVQ